MPFMSNVIKYREMLINLKNYCNHWGTWVIAAVIPKYLLQVSEFF